MLSKIRKIKESYETESEEERTEMEYLQGIEKKMHDFIIYFLDELWTIRTLLIIMILLIGIPQIIVLIMLLLRL